MSNLMFVHAGGAARQTSQAVASLVAAGGTQVCCQVEQSRPTGTIVTLWGQELKKC
jgi:hypothetical protein